MHAVSISQALSLIMEERGWTQVRLSAELGLSQPRVSRLISGERDLKITEAAEMLERVGWEVRIARKSEGDDPVRRREFIAVAASVTFVPSPKTGPYQSPEYLSALGQRIGRLRYEQGGTPLLPEVGRHLRGIRELSASSDRRLLASASFLADKLSLALFDAGKAGTAESVGRLALSLGRQSGDAQRIGAAYESLVIQTRRTNRGRASQYARRGIRVRELPDDLRARLQARYAATLSSADGHNLSMTAVESAQSFTLDSREGQAVVDGTTGLVLYRLGQISEGRKSLAKAIQAFDGLPGPYSRWMAQQVRASLLAHDFEAAASDMNKLALAVPLVNSVQLNEDLRDVFRLCARWSRIPEIGQASDALRDVSPAAARLLRG